VSLRPAVRLSLAIIVAAGALAHAVPAHAQPSGPAPIRAGVVARSSGDIVEAVLIGETARYRHFVLGTQYEAAGLRVKTREGKTLELILPDDAVFEDREPRIADLDGDGRSEIVSSSRAARAAPLSRSSACATAR
jgi:hypothetical protein